MANTPQNRMTELINSTTRHRAPIITDPEMYTPLVFPKHDRKMAIAAHLFWSSCMIYGVFFHDFGKGEHCFSPIRRFCTSKFNTLFSVHEEDKAYLNKRIDNIQSQIELVKEDRAKRSA